MKAFACVLLLVAFVAAEPPRYRLARFRYERQELGEGEKEATTPKAEEAPYPASGFKPSKEFKLPARQEVAPPATSYGIPDDSYGAPLRTYVAPPVEYGVPEPRAKGEGKEKKEGEEKKGDKPENEEGKEDEGEKGEAEKLKEGGEKKKEKLEEAPKKDAEVVSAQGAYYVLLPGSQLQRVQFQTENDYRNMAYTARLQYRDEDRAPLFVYTAVPQYQSSAYVQII